MKKFLQTTYLRLKDLFPKPKNKNPDEKVLKDIAKILDRYNYHGPEVTDEHLIEQLNEWQRLAGIMDWKNNVIRLKAVDTVYNEEVNRLIEKIKNDQKEFGRITQFARTAAERAVEANERAQYYGVAMESSKQAIFNEIAKIEKQWKEYFVKSGDFEETANRFAEFLVKKKFLTQKQVNKMLVGAVFIGGKIDNPLHFHREMKHVRENFPTK